MFLCRQHPLLQLTITMASMKFTDLEEAETVVMDNSAAVVDVEVKDTEEEDVVGSEVTAADIVDEEEVGRAGVERLEDAAPTNPRSPRCIGIGSHIRHCVRDGTKIRSHL
jgi:hypothetical protein